MADKEVGQRCQRLIRSSRLRLCKVQRPYTQLLKYAIPQCKDPIRSTSTRGVALSCILLDKTNNMSTTWGRIFGQCSRRRLRWPRSRWAGPVLIGCPDNGSNIWTPNPPTGAKPTTRSAGAGPNNLALRTVTACIQDGPRKFRAVATEPTKVALRSMQVVLHQIGVSLVFVRVNFHWQRHVRKCMCSGGRYCTSEFRFPRLFNTMCIQMTHTISEECPIFRTEQLLIVAMEGGNVMP